MVPDPAKGNSFEVWIKVACSSVGNTILCSRNVIDYALLAEF